MTTTDMRRKSVLLQPEAPSADMEIRAYGDARQAWLEGEGDQSLTYWARALEAFLRRELARAGFPFTEDVAVVCEEFEVVYP